MAPLGALAFAFEIAAQAKASARYPHAVLIRELAAASGSQGMVAGQVADLEGEGKKITPAELRYIHENKTAALIASSIRLGAMSANATAKQLERLTDFGESLGLAFQVIDDILDVTQTTEKLGKSAGKDIAAQKATYPALLGLDKAKKEADRLTTRARAAPPRMRSVSARSPSTKRSAPNSIVFPEPVSPLNTVKPAANSTAACAIRPKSSTVSRNSRISRHAA